MYCKEYKINKLNSTYKIVGTYCKINSLENYESDVCFRYQIKLDIFKG